ncbi:hypothetical protein KRR38_28020 [Novosphingobium sp. G106]|uniref:hypothetical protein n=1 Tax=Novosphingobium sp. G106 TaxID=2849500 RepID=UPI001C2CFBC8|nr:hypothetical protein [Novosphingobium sp. G106]MBV1691427.1 hypothetical protein [Novosphingobium sp. G106]
MDFMKWISSLDELLYEVISWLVFLPLTLWRTFIHPLEMMDYADRQLGLPEAEQYTDALSPPLFLALSLALAHGVATAAGDVDRLIANQHGLAKMITDDASALVFRLLVFAMFPLMMSVQFVRIRGLALDRCTLRLPFYAQCYPASLFALGLGFGTILVGLPEDRAHIAGLLLILIAVVYYLAVETRWFAAQMGRGKVRAFGSAIRGFVDAFGLLLVIGFLFTR